MIRSIPLNALICDLKLKKKKDVNFVFFSEEFYNENPLDLVDKAKLKSFLHNEFSFFKKEKNGFFSNAICFDSDAELQQTSKKISEFANWFLSAYEPSCKAKFSCCFLQNFPMFVVNSNGRLACFHHPFTMLKYEKDFDVVKQFVSKPDGLNLKKILQIKSLGYDLVINGLEVLSGSVRINNSEQQRLILAAMKLTKQQIDDMVITNHLHRNFFFSAGFACGIERLAMSLLGSKAISNMFFFPKDSKFKCYLEYENK